MNKFCIALALMLAGCTAPPNPMDTYQPPLAEKPANQAKYDKDLAECKEQSKTPDSLQNTMSLGLLGLAVASATDSYKTWTAPQTQTKDCLEKLGYKMKKPS